MEVGYEWVIRKIISEICEGVQLEMIIQTI